MFNEYMKQAINEAKSAFSANEVPVGAVLVCDNKIIAKSHNLTVQKNNPLYHAEVNVINEGLLKLNVTYLNNCSIYVTKEPCIMCMGAIINARVKRVYFGAYDVKYGASEELLRLMSQKMVNHYPEIYGGIMEKECKKLLEDFFRCNS